MCAHVYISVYERVYVCVGGGVFQSDQHPRQRIYYSKWYDGTKEAQQRQRLSGEPCDGLPGAIHVVPSCGTDHTPCLVLAELSDPQQ